MNVDMPSENILVIGNGFDLYHGLPTRYIDFLGLARRMLYNPIDKEIVIGEHFNDKRLKKVIPISICNMDNVNRFNEILRENSFVKYFLKKNYTNTGWIDFEHEIEKILREIEVAFTEKCEVIQCSEFIRINLKKYGGNT